MEDADLTEHYAAMKSGGYELERPDFLKLRSWHAVLFQTHSAEHSLTKLMSRTTSRGSLEDAHEEQALFSNFILQYSKCFTSGGKGQVTLDERRVFAGSDSEFVIHKRILEIRHNLVAHNGNNDLVKANLAVREEADRILVRHFLTFAMPKNELPSFKSALGILSNFVVISLNKHLDSLQEKFGKPVLLGNED